MSKLLDRIRQVWQQEEVPDFHQVPFEAKYGGGDYGPEVLRRELEALQRGDALVQRMCKLIRMREEVLMRLTLLRTAYSDEEFLSPGSLPRKHLYEQLEELRLCTFQSVEVLSSWRRFLKRQVDSCVVWPYDGPTGEVDLETPPEQDYLFQIADETVLREFEAVVELSHERDPFLLYKSTGGPGWKEPGRLSPPAAGRPQRFENARLQLMEDEMALSMLISRSAQEARQAEAAEAEAEGGDAESPTEPKALMKLIAKFQEVGLERTAKVAPHWLALLRTPTPATAEDAAEIPPPLQPGGETSDAAVSRLPIAVKRWCPKT